MFKSISVLLLTLLAASIVGPSSFADEKKEVLKRYQSDVIRDQVDYTEARMIIAKLEAILGKSGVISLAYYNGSGGKDSDGVYLKAIVPEGCSNRTFIVSEHIIDSTTEAVDIFHKRDSAFKRAAALIDRLSGSGDFQFNAIINTSVDSSWNKRGDGGHLQLTVTVTTIGPNHVCKAEADEKVESGKKDNKQAEAPADSEKQNPEANKQEKQESGNPR